ncbi:MAG: hypothetical protein ACQEQG_03245 [Bacillota bacterium]
MQKVIFLLACMGLLFVFVFSDQAAAQQLSLSGQSLRIDRERGIVELSTGIKGNYGIYHFHADEISIKLEEGADEYLRNPEEILMSPGSFTGCDLDEPHNYFQATTIEIYPGDYLVAYNVVFYELDGYLPLFYWPVLYISLDDDRTNLEFEYGYSSLRGWFGKLTYNYELLERPGQLYLDYYQLTGKAYGIKQHYVHNDKHKGYLYYYTQDNKLDLNQLFNYEFTLDHEYINEGWESGLLLNYFDYDNRYVAKGDLVISNETDDYEAQAAVDYERQIYKNSEEDDRELASVNLAYDRSFARGFDLYLDYNLDMTDYFNREDYDQRDSRIELGLAKAFAGGLNFALDYSRDLELKTDQRLAREEWLEVESDYSWGDGWQAEAAYETGQLKEPDVDLQERWAGMFKVGRQLNPFAYDLILERDAPSFSDENASVSFYRWPEINLYYRPRGSFNYQLQLGRYFEDETDISGYRSAAILDFRRNWRPFNFAELTSEQNLSGNLYHVPDVDEGMPRLLTYNSEVSLDLDLLNNLSFTNTHAYTTSFGRTPFNFDEVVTEEVVESEMRYRGDVVDLSLEGGYDLIDFRYLPLLGIARVNPNDNWQLRLETEYDLNEMEFSDQLDFVSRYRSNSFTATTSLAYDLNLNRLQSLRNNIDYEIEGDYGWSLSSRIRYDFEQPVEDRLREASIALRKKLHCRELRFSYDHIQREFIVSYHLDLFGGRGLSAGRSQDEGFLFEVETDEQG